MTSELTLRSVPIPSFLDTSANDLVKDFFTPALAASVCYDRGVGFFSSGWMRIASKGLVAFAENGGRARWVTSPILAPDDWQAIKEGSDARVSHDLDRVILRNINELAETLDKDTLSALAWMVADGILTFRLAVPRNKLEDGDFHDKFGILTDREGNSVTFNGSYNDSIQGTRNYESIKVFRSWEPSYDQFGKPDVARFARLWSNMDPNVRVYDVSEAALARILELRKNQRPYHGNQECDHLNSIVRRAKMRHPFISGDVVLRDYQNQAIQNWFDANCCGLFEMATGSGKTITALSATVRLFEERERLALIIAVPYQHLVDQWVREAKRFGYKPLKAYGGISSWIDELRHKTISFKLRDIENVCVVTTYATFSTEAFQNSISELGPDSLIVADEAHHMGAEQRRGYYPNWIDRRLALSATPERWFDPAGTAALRGYFGPTVFQFSLSDAIGTCLTPYYYIPVAVELTGDEMSAYKDITSKIGKQLAICRSLDDERLGFLLIKRANILNNAQNKVSALTSIVRQDQSVRHSLFYCSPGNIDAVANELAFELRLRVHRFTAAEPPAVRERILREFSSGELQGLVAMKCLDEGVDVPATRTAYILASSSNPREFIQRRGRVLRKSPGKDFATIYDFITVPPNDLDEVQRRAEKALLRRELRRFGEFADSAINTMAAYEVIWDIASKYDVLDFKEVDHEHA